MDKTRRTFASDRALTAQAEPLRGAVRRALRLSSSVIVAGLALGVVPIASAAPFPAIFPLASLLPAHGGDGSVGFVVNGIDAGDYSGNSVSDVGDVNGDGIGDFIIGANGADLGARTYVGESYVVFGRAAQAGNFPAVFPLASLLPANGGNGSAGFVLYGIDDGDYSGISVSAAGDVNGDGFDDLIIGATGADPGGRSHAGESYVVFGRDTAQVGNFPAIFPLATLLPGGGGDGSAGFVLPGIVASDDSGLVSAAGDVNGDGLDDLIIGASGAAPGGRGYAGQSYVVFGRDTAQVGNFPAVFPLASLLPGGGGDGSAGFVLNGIDRYDFSGRSVSAAGDVNGDTIGDLLIGASNAAVGAQSGVGESYVVFGRDTAQVGKFPAVFPLASLLPGGGGDGSAGFVLNGIDARDYSGGIQAISAAGDVNGDGLDDLIIGASSAEPGGRNYAGESYVVFGRDTALVGNFPAIFPLASLLPGGGGNGSAGFVLHGIDLNDLSGASVSAAGDVNGDGLDDLLIGAYGADPGGRSDAGESYVVFGRDTAQAGAFPAVFALASLMPSAGGDGSTGFVLHGIATIDESGRSVSAAGDVNGDGLDDLIIGASYANPGGRSDAGESYVVFGRGSAQ